VSLLTRRLARLAEEYRVRTGVDVDALLGSGAAGGLAGGLAAIGARLEPGFDLVADAVGLETAIDNADLVVTGEGRFDRTSLEGKVVGGVLAAADGRARRAVIAGQIEKAVADLVPADVLALALTDRVWQAGEAFARAALLVQEAAFEVAQWSKTVS